MSVHPKTTPAGTKGYVVRWREGDRNRSRSFTRKRDAEAYNAEVERRRQLGPVAVQMLDAGSETLNEYVRNQWAPGHTAHLAPRTRHLYGTLYDGHIRDYLGSVPLRELTPDRVARWQTQRISAGAGREVIRKAHMLLGSILQRAVESQRIAANPQRLVRKVKSAPKQEIRPLAPVNVEAIRSALLNGVVRTDSPKRHARKAERKAISYAPLRDATMVSVLAYAGLRPSEALGLRWGNLHDRTMVVNATKTDQRRSVRLLAPLATDLTTWKLASTNTADSDLVFPADNGEAWTLEAYKSWARRAYSRAAVAADRPDVTPYTARHSFASLLLHEGRSVIYVARQLGHSAHLTMTTYGHVIEELDEAPRVTAEAAIRAARGDVVLSEFPEAL